jgi:hypothetical protein
LPIQGLVRLVLVPLQRRRPLLLLARGAQEAEEAFQLLLTRSRLRLRLLSAMREERLVVAVLFSDNRQHSVRQLRRVRLVEEIRRLHPLRLELLRIRLDRPLVIRRTQLALCLASHSKIQELSVAEGPRILVEVSLASLPNHKRVSSPRSDKTYRVLRRYQPPAR